MPTTQDQTTSPIPQGHRSLAPYLYVRGASRAMDFYAAAFGARELFHMAAPNGQIAHAEMQIGDSILMLADENPAIGALSPESTGGTSGSVFLYVVDVDTVCANALGAGATAHTLPADMFWGDRLATLRDPFGHEWSIATHIEDVSPNEMHERGARVSLQ